MKLPITTHEVDHEVVVVDLFTDADGQPVRAEDIVKAVNVNARSSASCVVCGGRCACHAGLPTPNGCSCVLAEEPSNATGVRPQDLEGVRPQDLEARLTAAVREADLHFEKVGGSSRHFVRDCLLPALAEAKLKVVDA